MNNLPYFKNYYNCKITILLFIIIVFVKEYEDIAKITHMSVHILLF